MTLFNFEFTNNYSNIAKNDVFKYYFKKSLIVCGITLFIGILIGIYLGSTHTISVVKFVVADSGSAHLMAATTNSDLLRFLATFFNNLLVAGLLLVIPIQTFNIIKQQSENGTRKTYLSAINPIWVGYLIIAVQMLLVGNFIGYAIPIVNDIPLIISSLIPHGIIEIGIILASGAVGMAYVSKNNNFNFSYNDLLNFFVRIVLPIIMVAAFIETYITPIVVSLA